MARICHTTVVRRRPEEIHRAAFAAVLEVEQRERIARIRRQLAKDVRVERFRRRSGIWQTAGEALLVLSCVVVAGLVFWAAFRFLLTWMVSQ
jgi:hypothetical protein